MQELLLEKRYIQVLVVLHYKLYFCYYASNSAAGAFVITIATDGFMTVTRLTQLTHDLQS